jgi:hypothetical protein
LLEQWKLDPAQPGRRQVRRNIEQRWQAECRRRVEYRRRIEYGRHVWYWRCVE